MTRRPPTDTGLLARLESPPQRARLRRRAVVRLQVQGGLTRSDRPGRRDVMPAVEQASALKSLLRELLVLLGKGHGAWSGHGRTPRRWAPG